MEHGLSQHEGYISEPEYVLQYIDFLVQVGWRFCCVFFSVKRVSGGGGGGAGDLFIAAFGFEVFHFLFIKREKAVHSDFRQECSWLFHVYCNV